MPLETIAQADLYSTNDVFRGIVEEIIEDSPIFNFMPFVGILGNSLQYLPEAALPALMPAAQKVAAGSGTPGGPGTFEKLAQAIDLCKPRPDVLMMGRRARRGIRKLARGQGWDLALSAAGSINRPILHYGDIPIVINDFLTITEDVSSGFYLAKTGDDTESIFCIRFAEDGFHGISAGTPFTPEKVADSLEAKDATRDRIKAYVGTVLKSTLSISMLSGIDDQAWTN